MTTSEGLIVAAQKLSAAVRKQRFDAPVTHVYNPLDYAARAHEIYLRRYGNSTKRVIFLGMNPGPFGMAQTGIPFGQIAAIRDWLGITAKIDKPRKENSKRPVLGFDCHRSEISGERLWGLFARRFGTADKFFREHIVMNYCPLAFVEESGRNRTRTNFRRASARNCLLPATNICARSFAFSNPNGSSASATSPQNARRQFSKARDRAPDKSCIRVRPRPHRTMTGPAKSQLKW